MKKKDYYKLLIFIKNAEKIRNKIPLEQQAMFDKNLDVARQELKRIKGC